MFDELTITFTPNELVEHYNHDVMECKICTKLNNLKRHMIKDKTNRMGLYV